MLWLCLEVLLYAVDFQSDTLIWHSVLHSLLAYSPFIGIQSDTLYWHSV